jgi:hypothetical protein
MNKPRTLAFGLATLALAGCSTGAITGPEAPDGPKRDGAYLGAGFNVQTPPPPNSTASDSTQRGGAYLGAGF